MKKVKLAPITLTEDQKIWATNEASRTGETISSVIRSLIQEKIDAQTQGEK